MEPNELRRRAQKIVNETKRNGKRLRAFGWDTLAALAEYYIINHGDMPVIPHAPGSGEVVVGHVERVAGGQSSALPADFRTETISQAEGLRLEFEALTAKALPIVDKISEAQFIALQAIKSGDVERITEIKKPVLDALIRKELLLPLVTDIGGAETTVTGMSTLGRLVETLAAEKFRP